MKLVGYLTILASALLAPQTGGYAQPTPSPAAVVREILSVPDDQLDYGHAKLAFDRIVDPSLR